MYNYAMKGSYFIGPIHVCYYAMKGSYFIDPIHVCLEIDWFCKSSQNPPIHGMSGPRTTLCVLCITTTVFSVATSIFSRGLTSLDQIHELMKMLRSRHNKNNNIHPLPFVNILINSYTSFRLVNLFA